MGSTATHSRSGGRPTSASPQPASPDTRRVSARRHLVWLIGGMSVAFLVPFVLADQLALQRELYYAIYVGAVVGLFVGWARDTGQSPREMITRRWRLAVHSGCWRRR